VLKQLPFYKDRASYPVLNLWMAKGRGVIVFCKVFYQLLILLNSVIAGFLAEGNTSILFAFATMSSFPNIL
jgi:hypothetical protein